MSEWGAGQGDTSKMSVAIDLLNRPHRDPIWFYLPDLSNPVGFFLFLGLQNERLRLRALILVWGYPNILARRGWRVCYGLEKMPKRLVRIDSEGYIYRTISDNYEENHFWSDRAARLTIWDDGLIVSAQISSFLPTFRGPKSFINPLNMDWSHYMAELLHWFEVANSTGDGVPWDLISVHKLVAVVLVHLWSTRI